MPKKWVDIDDDEVEDGVLLLKLSMMMLMLIQKMFSLKMTTSLKRLMNKHFAMNYNITYFTYLLTYLLVLLHEWC